MTAAHQLDPAPESAPRSERERVLLEGLLGAAEEIVGLREVVGELVQLLVRSLVLGMREDALAAELDRVLAREDDAARRMRPALRSLLAALEALPALEAAAAQGTRDEVLAALGPLAAALRGAR